MQYITYDEYREMGGLLDLTAFNRIIDRACGVINNETHNRIESMCETPRAVKSLCFALLEYMADNTLSPVEITAESQSANGVSENVSYTVKTKEELKEAVDNIIYEYLGSISDDNGTPLLYRGCSR